MSTFELVAISFLGMSLVAGVSFAIYSALPRSALNLAAEHGRYIGLGTADTVVAGASGNRPVSHVGTLHGQSA